MNRDVRAFILLVSFVTVTSLLALTGLSHGKESQPLRRAAVECVLREMPRSKYDFDENSEAQASRLRTAASAMSSATNDPDELAWLLMTGWHESRYSGFVGRDDERCHSAEDEWCDYGRSWSYWQLQRTDRSGGGGARGPDRYPTSAEIGSLLRGSWPRLLAWRHRNVRNRAHMQVAPSESAHRFYETSAGQACQV